MIVLNASAALELLLVTSAGKAVVLAPRTICE